MVLFPMYFLKSFAYAGIAVVAFAAVAAIVVAPAAIVLLGDRLDSLDVRRLVGRSRQAGSGAQAGRADLLVPLDEIRYAPVDSDRRRDHRAAVGARRAVPRYQVGLPDDRVLPRRRRRDQVGDELRNNFAVDSATQRHRRHSGHHRDHASPTSTATPRSCRRSPTSSVSSPGGTFVAGGTRLTAVGATGIKDGSAFLTVGSNAPLFSTASETQLDRLHAVSTPAGQPVQLTGVAQINRDSSEAITSRLPLVSA